MHWQFFMFELYWRMDSLQRNKTCRGLEASGQHHWPLGGESPSSCSGGTPLVAAEPSDPVIKETKVAGGSERAHNVNTGGGVVFWSPTSTPKMGSVRSLSERLESLPFVCIVCWLNVIRCHDQQVWMNFTPDDSWCRLHFSFSEMARASQEQFKIATSHAVYQVLGCEHLKGTFVLPPRLQPSPRCQFKCKKLVLLLNFATCLRVKRVVAC